MQERKECPLAAELAERLRAARDELTQHWLERIAERVQVDAIRVFPTQELLDHIPLLLIGLADQLEDPAEEITGRVPVVSKAMELGALRLSQDFDAHEILKEYEILGGVLFSFLIRIVDEIPGPCTRGELLTCARRLHHGISLIQQVTTDHYLRKMNERIRERENQLRGFNRTVSHELKNRIGSLQNAGELLGSNSIDAEKRGRLQAIVRESTRDITQLIDNLARLSRIDARVTKHDVPLRQAIAEAIRQVRDLAAEKGVAVRVRDDLPDVRVNGAAVELCLSNYLTNAIKYCDPTKAERYAEVRGYVRPREAAGPEKVVIEVWDNGRGIPEHSRSRLFEQFFRVSRENREEVHGMGLGLSIVRDTVESLGGSAWAQHRSDGSTFAFCLPFETHL